MMGWRGRQYERRLRLPAVLTAIETLLGEFRVEAGRRLTRTNAFAAELLLRETLNNAVLHGCASDPAREFDFVLRLDSCRLAIAVRDGGAGFDWQEARQRTARADALSGRGMAILRQYATRVRFNSPGNSVVILKRFV